MASILVDVHGGNGLPHGGLDRRRLERHLELPCLQAGDAEKIVDDPDEALGFLRDVAEKARPLGIGELDVGALKCLREAVDRGERRAKLVRDRRDEVGLHLIDDALARDVPEGEDPARDRPCRVAHDRLAEREPHLVPVTADGDAALAGRPRLRPSRALVEARPGRGARAPRTPGRR